MTTPVWVRDAADRFWGRARRVPPFPRNLRAVITVATPLSVVARAGLRLRTVIDELDAMKVGATIAEDDRPLRACLFCRNETGIIFLDSADPPDEQRFSLAHELAHFLRDYDAVRRRVEKALGPAALEVVDGRRPPTTEEQLHAVLRNVDAGPRFHLLGRDEAGRPKSPEERDAEERADRLAFELLAPAEMLQTEASRAALTARLTAEFGLPLQQAGEYAAIMLPPEPSAGSLVERLRKFC